jgi:glycosyltransferase involved in cell wall biosynthesis
MRVAFSIVGRRTEHWEGLFTALAERTDLELIVQAADISVLARDQLEALARRKPRFRVRIAPHLVGENPAGHMASVVFRPGSWRGLENANPDVLHVIGEAAYLSTYQAIRFRNRFWPGVPMTLYAAQNVVTRFPWPFPRLERYAYEQTALALPITPAALTVLRRKGFCGPAKILPLGVDRGRFQPRLQQPPPPFTVGYVGRLEPHKGITHLLAARDLLGCRLVAVGDGSLRAWLQTEAERRTGRVELVPWVSHTELPRLLRRLHALVLPSVATVQRHIAPWIKIPLQEQFGRVLVEAMASGVPVIGSRVGEIPHVIGSSGLIVPPGDPGALMQALARIRDVPGVAEELTRSGLERAARFAWSRLAEELSGHWSDLVAARAAEPLRWAA